MGDCPREVIENEKETFRDFCVYAGFFHISIFDWMY